MLCAGAGGANRSRTGDLLRAKQALSQLSYGPLSSIDIASALRFGTRAHAVRRCPPGTSVPNVPLAIDIWWVWVDLNYRPHPYQGCALTD